MMQVRFLCQLLLGKTSLLAVVADFVAQYTAMKWFQRHFSLIEQEARRPYTHYTVVFTCMF